MRPQGAAGWAIRSFAEGDRQPAAALVTAWGARLAALDPPLAGWGGEALEAALGRERSGGFVAERGGALVGYLLGAPIDGPPWRRSAWTGLGGWALAAGEPVSTMEDLYARAAEGWVADGRFEHVVVVPAAAGCWESWFQLGFGVEQVHALRPTDGLEAAVPAGVEVRRAGPADQALVLPLVDVVARQLVSSPAFAPSTAEWRADFPEGHAELLADDDVRYWVAVEGGAAVAFAVLSSAEPGPGIPAGCAVLDLAATAPQARRRGIGRALLAAGLAEARAEGKPLCATDWRSASLLAARAWTGLGFRPTHYRLRRRMDDRIAWARL